MFQASNPIPRALTYVEPLCYWHSVDNSQLCQKTRQKPYLSFFNRIVFPCFQHICTGFTHTHIHTTHVTVRSTGNRLQNIVNILTDLSSVYMGMSFRFKMIHEESPDVSICTNNTFMFVIYVCLIAIARGVHILFVLCYSSAQSYFIYYTNKPGNIENQSMELGNSLDVVYQVSEFRLSIILIHHS